jgi:V8-like Glu-specific endopeptidase
MGTLKSAVRRVPASLAVDHGEEYELPPPPLRLDELVTAVKPRSAKKPPTDATIHHSLWLASDDKVKVSQRLAAVKEGAAAYQLSLQVQGAAIGRHALPPKPNVREFESEHDVRQRQRAYPNFKGYLPDHLGLSLLPRHVPRELAVPRRLREAAVPDRPRDVHEATTIFGPDNRYIFFDTAFPWCTTGRVDTPGGVASGTMVGPRHMLTCSHTIQWNSDGTAGWVKFTPSYFDGSAPFGVAWGTWIYWEGVKVVGPSINRDEGQHDYVCVVLDWRIGDLTGWMGSRSWSDDWDGGSYWSHIGYPGDLAGAQRPSYQSGIALDGSFWDREVHTRIFHQGDVWPGQSGGPFFGWWEGEAWPRVVADQSGQNADENSASGGAHMVDCIIRARNDFP